TRAVGRNIIIRRGRSRRSARTAHAVRVVALPQFLRASGNERWAGGYGYGHHAIAIAVVKLASVPLPHWIGAAIVRNLDFRAGSWKGLHVNLWLSGFIRAIGEPAPLGREFRRSLRRFVLIKCFCGLLAIQTSNHDIRRDSRPLNRVYDRASIGRPGLGALGNSRRWNLLRCAAAIRRNMPQGEAAHRA